MQTAEAVLQEARVMPLTSPITGLRPPQMSGCSWTTVVGLLAWNLIRQPVALRTVALLLFSFLSPFGANASETADDSVDLSQGWRILQDVHDEGEQLGVFRPDWNPFAVGPAMSDWE